MKGFLITVFCFLLIYPAIAQEKYTNKQFFNFDAGRYTVHDDETWGFAFSAKYGRELLNGFSWTTGLDFG